MGINFAAIGIAAISILGIVILAVSIGVAVKAFSGNVKKSVGSLIIVGIAAVIAAIGVGGAIVIIGSNILDTTFI